ncbi:MAG: hypothetical protein COB17_05185 [Sulfurimonas sp.]|nr:MAG: hypothetical protein COB17_05185 [Sulfurimonas sp.]
MIKSILQILIIGLFATGCSTMISPEKTSVYIQSKKDGQAFIVKDTEGTIVAKAITPAVIKLDNKGDSSYTYLTQCETKLEESEMNEWVFGNLLMVSITGLIIDISNGYSNEPVDKVSLLNCNTVRKKKIARLARKQDCGNYVNEYDRSIYDFNYKKNKKTIYNLKYSQDHLLKYCSDYVDISHYRKQASTINRVYASYL